MSELLSDPRIALAAAGAGINPLTIILLGVLVGLVSGMFGVGGGFLLTPLLGVLFEVPMPLAVGTGLCMMVGSSTVATLRYRELGHGEVRVALLMLPGSLVGVAAGARIVDAMSGLGSLRVANQSVPTANVLLLSGYSVFLVGLAFVLWQQAKGSIESLDFVRRGPITQLRLPLPIELPSVPLRRVSAMGIAYVGLLLGLCSGVLGIGGGIILIPILLYGYGFPFRHAAGTGIVVTLLTAIFGTCLHAMGGRVHLGLAMMLLMGSGISARVGVLLTRHLSVRSLRRGLTMVVLATALLVLSRLLGPFLEQLLS